MESVCNFCLCAVNQYLQDKTINAGIAIDILEQTWKILK